MRKKVIAANWKMFKNAEQAREFMHAFVPMIAGHTRDEVVICPPFTCIEAVAELATAPGMGVGAQDLFWEREGAFTGEVSAPMLLAAGCTHVIIGHSERRQYFGESDETVNKKIRAALDVGLTPIVCVGEVLQEREAGLTDDVLRRQCLGAFRELSGAQGAKLTIAYEPVWAIGTGKTATPQIAAAAHEVIRKEAANAFGQDVAAGLRILYGGSVKPENATALMSQAQIDGALVGGASLQPKSFAAIVKY
jgi:triosephosphate isomerase (TIM)